MISLIFLSGPMTKTLRTVWLSAGVRPSDVPAMLAGSTHDRLLRTSEQATLLAFDRATFAEMIATGDALSRELGASVNADLVTALDALDQVEARILAMRRGHAVAA